MKILQLFSPSTYFLAQLHNVRQILLCSEEDMNDDSLLCDAAHDLSIKNHTHLDRISIKNHTHLDEISIKLCSKPSNSRLMIYPNHRRLSMKNSGQYLSNGMRDLRAI